MGNTQKALGFNELDFSQRVAIAFEQPQYALDNIKVDVWRIHLNPNFEKYESGCLKKDMKMERDRMGRWIKKKVNHQLK